MSAEDESRIAAALDATPELLPYLPELLADLWELGSSPALITDWLRELELPPAATRVLDLGCGKGAVSLTVARELGFRVHGVDLFEPLLAEARAGAAAWGLAGLCRFDRGDLREVVRTAKDYDVVVYASVGALGALDACVAALRECVRGGGYMVIEDGCLARLEVPEPGFEHYVGLEESRQRLAARGDLILRERLRGPEEMQALDASYIRCIRARAESLAAAHAEDAALILGYVDAQQRAAAAWERNALSAAWLLRRA